MHLIEQCPALSPSKRRPKVPQPSSSSPNTLQLPQTSLKSPQLSTAASLQLPKLSSDRLQASQPLQLSHSLSSSQPTIQPPSLTKSSQTPPSRLTEPLILPKECPTQPTDKKVPADALQKVSECAVTTLECENPSTCGETTSCVGEDSTAPGTELQRIGKDQTREQIDKRTPKEEKVKD